MTEPGPPRLSPSAAPHPDARARELEAVQALGRRAAGARDARELFDGVLELLRRRLPLESVAIAHDGGDGPEIRIYSAREAGPEFRATLTRHAARLLDLDPARVSWFPLRFDGEDPVAGPRTAFDPEAAVAVPVVRRGRVAAYLLAEPDRRARESELRLLYSAGNQLSVHLDRILSARAEEAGRFRAMLDGLPQAVWLAGPDLRALQSNRAADALLASIPGVDDLPALAEKLDLGPLLRAAVEDDGSLPRATEVVLDGSRVFDVSVGPFAPSGRRSGFLIVLTDVTEQRKLQAQLAQSEKMSSLGQMISGVAHELNNPLATILASAQLVRAWGGDDRLGRRVRILQDEAERCRRIVQNLLSFARKHDPEIRSLSLNDVVASVVALMAYQLKVDGIRIETRTDPELPATAGDPHRIRQALVNLFNNARHAMADRGGTLTVATRRIGDDRIRLEVSDTGPGVPDALRSRIFDPFFTTKAEGQGTGLGLSIVFGIVEAHGGTIELLPHVEGEGAAFRIELPVRKPARTGADPGTQSRPAGRAAAAPVRVLVVDDEDRFARLVRDALAEAGHHACAETSLEAARSRLEREPYDLLVQDLKMPGLSAGAWRDEVLTRWPRYRGRILWTTGDTVGESVRAVAADERTVLHKPFDLDTLLDRVRALAPGVPGDGLARDV